MATKSPSSLVRQLTESVITEAKPVIIAQRPVDYWQCPHCNEEIHEKHAYPEEPMNESSRVMVHSDCGGRFLPPPPTAAEQSFIEMLKSGFQV